MKYPTALLHTAETETSTWPKLPQGKRHNHQAYNIKYKCMLLVNRKINDWPDVTTADCEWLANIQL